MAVELSFCVVNTEQRALLRYCLDAIARERATVDFETEVLVLDNASADGSAEVARQHPTVTEVIALPERRGKGENDSLLLRRGRGRFCLLLDEDSELEPGATVALHAALAADDRAGAAGAMLVRPDGQQRPSAWRFPSPTSALAGALSLERVVVQSRGDDVREVDWVQSAAMLVRREAAEEIGYFDPEFFVYSDEPDFCRRLADAGWRTLYVPAARAVRHDPRIVADDGDERRVVELARNRDRYMRKHHSALAAALVRWLTAWSCAWRAAGAALTPGRDPRGYAREATATLFPARGVGLRDAVDGRGSAHGEGDGRR